MTSPIKQTKKIALTISTVIMAIITLFIAIVFLNRLALSYNSEGKYFDENSSTVYHEQAIAVYGLLFFVGTSLTLLALYKTRRTFYK